MCVSANERERERVGESSDEAIFRDKFVSGSLATILSSAQLLRPWSFSFFRVISLPLSLPLSCTHTRTLCLFLTLTLMHVRTYARTLTLFLSSRTTHLASRTTFVVTRCVPIILEKFLDIVASMKRWFRKVGTCGERFLVPYKN